MPIVTDTQSHIIHIDTHLAAANEAAASLQQGGNPQEIVLFLQGIGQHVQQHLQRLSTDPSRRPQVEAYTQQLQMLSQTIEQLGQLIQEQAQAMAQQQQAMAIQQGVDPKTAVLNAEVQAKIARQNAEVMANIQRQNTKAMADLSRRNAKTTADIQRANATAENSVGVAKKVIERPETEALKVQPSTKPVNSPPRILSLWVSIRKQFWNLKPIVI